MLAYVFWHWKQPEVDAATYESLQRRFHAALAASPSAGLVRSFSHAIEGAPWAAQGREAYEDWYLVRDAAALEPLNAAAISASRKGPHDAAAAAAAGGAAGLYQQLMGEPSADAQWAHWFAKPDGMSYAELRAALAPALERANGALWCRFMVLGPSPEFCALTTRPMVVPAPFDALALRLRTIVG